MHVNYTSIKLFKKKHIQPKKKKSHTNSGHVLIPNGFIKNIQFNFRDFFNLELQIREYRPIFVELSEHTGCAQHASVYYHYYYFA